MSSIIDTIDQAIADSTVSDDAMRSVPDDTDGIRVVYIDPDCDQPISFRYLARDDDGSTFRAMQKLVDGLVDVVRVTEGLDVWVNDAGLLIGMPLNERATTFVHAVKYALASDEWPGGRPGWLSVADALEDAVLAQRHTRLVGPAIIAGCNDEGETISVPDAAVTFISEAMGLM
ncbi:DUF3846 domain-containing protein [Micromonospora aurantiaca (nom. illeg.)]|uniref:DUF3846 domain-containing protein n=1 Tax=Micromonospora aurantiaca (nom. illeg.) TaxID=47850 RepID=UPI001656DBAF|nr:DUF3846 domain-containing protein [Micromonospora aurantiaca]MBC9000470.1 DUF3846 domain-containing protein [Micromonospora aurantiaca]